jgi:hypothetical protein
MSTGEGMRTPSGPGLALFSSGERSGADMNQAEVAERRTTMAAPGHQLTRSANAGPRRRSARLVQSPPPAEDGAERRAEGHDGEPGCRRPAHCLGTSPAKINKG